MRNGSGTSSSGIPLKPKEGLTPISCHAALKRPACAPFIKERRIECINPTNLHRKSGQWGTQHFVTNRVIQDLSREHYICHDKSHGAYRVSSGPCKGAHVSRQQLGSAPSTTGPSDYVFLHCGCCDVLSGIWFDLRRRRWRFVSDRVCRPGFREAGKTEGTSRRSLYDEDV